MKKKKSLKCWQCFCLFLWQTKIIFGYNFITALIQRRKYIFTRDLIPSHYSVLVQTSNIIFVITNCFLSSSKYSIQKDCNQCKLAGNLPNLVFPFKAILSATSCGLLDPLPIHLPFRYSSGEWLMRSNNYIAFLFFGK